MQSMGRIGAVHSGIGPPDHNPTARGACIPLLERCSAQGAAGPVAGHWRCWTSRCWHGPVGGMHCIRFTGQNLQIPDLQHRHSLQRQSLAQWLECLHAHRQWMSYMAFGECSTMTSVQALIDTVSRGLMLYHVLQISESHLARWLLSGACLPGIVSVVLLLLVSAAVQCL